ncbi:MAG: hypothetical protein AAFV97_02520 [Bacteroidota bacterium]
MHIPFEKLSDQSHIWIYASQRPIHPQQQAHILQLAQTFTDTWTSHGQPLTGSATLLHNHFLILAAENTGQPLSCCREDSIITLMHQIKGTLDIDLMNRTHVTLAKEDHIWTLPIQAARAQIRNKTLPASTHIFDNTISYKGNLVDKWKIPVEASWLCR